MWTLLLFEYTSFIAPVSEFWLSIRLGIKIDFQYDLNTDDKVSESLTFLHVLCLDDQRCSINYL